MAKCEINGLTGRIRRKHIIIDLVAHDIEVRDREDQHLWRLVDDILNCNIKSSIHKDKTNTINGHSN